MAQAIELQEMGVQFDSVAVINAAADEVQVAAAQLQPVLRKMEGYCKTGATMDDDRVMATMVEYMECCETIKASAANLWSAAKAL